MLNALTGSRPKTRTACPPARGQASECQLASDRFNNSALALRKQFVAGRCALTPTFAHLIAALAWEDRRD